MLLNPCPGRRPLLLRLPGARGRRSPRTEGFPAGNRAPKVFQAQFVKWRNACPQYEINTVTFENGGKATAYNDNEWHTVTLVITEAMIQLHIDDHDYFQ